MTIMTTIWVLLLSAGNPQWGVPVLAFASKDHCEQAAASIRKQEEFHKAAGPKGVATCVEVVGDLNK